MVYELYVNKKMEKNGLAFLSKLLKKEISFLKSLLILLQYCSRFMFWLLVVRLVGSYLPNQGLNSHSLY